MKRILKEKLLFKDGLSILVANISSLAANFAVGIFVARYLGPEKFGLLNYSYSLVALTFAISRLGLENIVVRELVINKLNKLKVLGSAFVLKLCSSSVVTLIFISVGLFWIEDDTEGVLIAIISANLVIETFLVIEYMFRAEIKNIYKSKAQITAAFLVSGFKFALILLEADIIFFALSYVLEAVVISIYLIVSYNKHQSDSLLEWKVSSKVSKYLIVNSYPLILAGLATVVNLKIDKVMIKSFLDSADVGQYAIATRLSEVWYFIPMAVTTTLFPKIIGLANTNSENFYKKLQGLFSILFYLAVSFAVFIFFLGDFIVELFLGIEYMPAASVLKIHIWAAIFIFIGQPAKKALVALNLQKITFLVSVGAAITNIVLNIFLIPEYGIEGAAYASLLSYACGSFFFYILFMKSRKIFITQVLGIIDIRNMIKLLRI